MNRWIGPTAPREYDLWPRRRIFVFVRYMFDFDKNKEDRKIWEKLVREEIKDQSVAKFLDDKLKGMDKKFFDRSEKSVTSPKSK